MAGSILNSYLEDPPQPGEHPSVEHIRASFTLSSSVASVAHSFIPSYARTPEIVTSAPQGNNDVTDVWVESASASGATFGVRTRSTTGLAASNAASILLDIEVRPDLS